MYLVKCKDSIMSVENIYNLVLEKEVPKKNKKTFEYEFNLWILNGNWRTVTSSLRQYPHQILLKFQIALLLDELREIGTIYRNAIIIIIIMRIIISCSHMLEAW